MLSGQQIFTMAGTECRTVVAGGEKDMRIRLFAEIVRLFQYFQVPVVYHSLDGQSRSDEVGSHQVAQTVLVGMSQQVRLVDNPGNQSVDAVVRVFLHIVAVGQMIVILLDSFGIISFHPLEIPERIVGQRVTEQQFRCLFNEVSFVRSQ